jgi:hypothetical protein
MKTHFARILTVSVILVGSGRLASAQGFVNLNFESANLSGYSPGNENVPVTAALPGWTSSLYYPGSGTIVPSTYAAYDIISAGGALVSINDVNTGNGFVPLQGTYSAMLFGGGGNNLNLASASLSQTAVVPAGTESLQMQIGNYGDSFVVTLGGQTINMVPLAVYPTYTEYGGDVSTFAGLREALSITEPAPAGTPPSILELDNIQFLTSPVPEPGTLALLVAGAALLGLRRRGSR